MTYDVIHDDIRMKRISDPENEQIQNRKLFKTENENETSSTKMTTLSTKRTTAQRNYVMGNVNRTNII